jgi:hypothetical protein
VPLCRRIFRSEEIHSVRPPHRLPSPRRHPGPGYFLAAADLLWRAASPGSRSLRAAGLRVRCAYAGAWVVVVVVVAGEAAAWAGTITDLTTGVTQHSGRTSALNEAPHNAI